MFDNLKKVQELKRMQDALKQERETVQKKGISVTVNGGLEVERIMLNPALTQDETAETIRQCVNEANKNMQKRLAKMMSSFDFGGLA